MSEFIRRTRLPLTAFVALVRCQTPEDYQPNKALVPDTLKRSCTGYEKLPELLEAARYRVRVNIRHQPTPQTHRPSNHTSACQRLDILPRNVRKEQDAMRCLVLDEDILAIWSEVRISPFGVIDKRGNGSQPTGRTIPDLSYSTSESIIDITDRDQTERPSYQHCDAVVREILRIKS